MSAETAQTLIHDAFSLFDEIEAAGAYDSRQIRALNGWMRDLAGEVSQGNGVSFDPELFEKLLAKCPPGVDGLEDLRHALWIKTHPAQN